MGEPLIHDLLERVRRRWRRLLALRAVVRAALASALVLAVALVVARIVGRAPVALAAVGVATLVLVAAAAVWGLWPAREVPSDQRVARFIEEADATLGDSFASAVALLSASEPAPQTPLAAPMLADAARRASRIDPATVVPPPRLRRAGFQAAAAVLLFGAIGVGGRSTARQSFDALSLSLFPAHIRLDVTPGDARIMVGSPFAIEARLSGNSAPVVARLLVADGDATDAPWRATEMAADASGGFRAFQEGVNASFRYRVSAGAATSPIYRVAVARPPRVTRIDLDYTFPKELGLPARSEEDTGDIYAPAGSAVRVRVHTDREVASGRMAFGDGSAASLTAEGPTVMAATVNVVEDGSYRVALADSGGLSSAGDTEYFIRTLEDRPPDVHVVHPARDREVTRLEEVDIEARADDDFGIASMDLVYAVRGGPEKVVPFAIPARAVSATGTRTLYLEDLNVQAGDFISYYVRARDLSRGKQSSETKSDLFFLEVRPFDQEFTLADSQGSGAGSGNRQLDDLVQAQKDVIVATWKLDRRGQAAGKTSPDDVRAVAKAESELKRRVEETASAFGESTLRDPRARGPQRATQARPGEDDMTAAASAMGKAVATLGELETTAAVPPEMDALNHLLRAQADVKERQVQMQQAGSGNGANRSNLDLSNLFDKELQRQQKTSYESKAKAESDQNPTELDKIRDLAKRQDELNQRQQELARKRGDLPAEELKRELEKLTRDQSDLRQKAEELAQEMGSQGSKGSTGSQGSQGSQSSQGSQPMRDASEAMRNATNSLRQQNPGTASAQGAQASDKLRALADQLGSQGTDGAETRRRELGNMQLEARQMADAERQIASSLQGASPGGRGRGSASTSGSASADDANRRLAGDEERLAERAARVQAGLKAQAAAAAADAKEDRADSRQAIASAARDFERQRMAERMKQAADALRSGTAQDPDGAAETQMARDLDRLADALASAVRPADAESQKLTGQRAQAEALRAEIDRLSAAMKQATNSSELTKLRDQYARQLQQVQQLVDQLKREDPSFAAGGVGVTFEGQGMTLSAPGTEAFKQDFAKWDDLRVKAADALARAESSIDQRLQANDRKDRLAAGADDRPPAAYQTQVNSYFKALADRKKP